MVRGLKSTTFVVLGVVFAVSMALTRPADAICGRPAPGPRANLTVSDVRVELLSSGLFTELGISGEVVNHDQDHRFANLESLPLTATVLNPAAAGCCFSEFPADGSTIKATGALIVLDDAGDPVSVSLGGHCRVFQVTDLPDQLSYVEVPNPYEKRREQPDERLIVAGLAAALVISAAVTWSLARHAAARSAT
jgi:hypothetical protein